MPPRRRLPPRPPPEAVLFFRSTGGLSQNLRLLEAAGNFRQVFEDVVGLPGPAPQ